MTLRIGLIGAGRNTKRRHIPGFQSISGVEIVAIANRSLESANLVAKEFGIPRVYETPEELLKDPHIDAVCIGTWPYQHAHFTIQALENNKHVLVEARMASNNLQAHQMLIHSQERPHLVAMIVPAPDTLGYDHQILEVIQKKLGKVHFVDLTSFTGAFANDGDPITWRQLKEYSGDNIFFNGIYAETLSRWLGPFQKVRAQGRIHRKNGPHWLTGEEISADVPDLLLVEGVFQRNEVLFQARMGTICGGPEREECWIYGEHGSLFIDICQKKVIFHENGTSFTSSLPIAQEEAWAVEKEFVESIRCQKPVERTNFKDGLAYMEYVSAVARSLHDGTWETLG